MLVLFAFVLASLSVVAFFLFVVAALAGSFVFGRLVFDTFFSFPLETNIAIVACLAAFGAAILTLAGKNALTRYLHHARLRVIS